MLTSCALPIGSGCSNDSWKLWPAPGGATGLHQAGLMEGQSQDYAVHSWLLQLPLLVFANDKTLKYNGVHASTLFLESYISMVFVLRPSVTLTVPTPLLDSELWWTGDFWSKTIFLK